jgi:superfamily I DNA and/or RNA helicase
MKPHQLRPLTEALAKEIKRECKKELERDPGRKTADLIKEWLVHVDASKAELQERVRSGASVVLATCNSATKHNVDRNAGAPLFDWVIVEEAARAWPTEIAIPLIRGFRWALVGDHKQLPAHRLNEVETFLRQCVESDNKSEIGVHGQHREEYMKTYRFFGELFKKIEEDAPKRKYLERPLGEMVKQFRMRSAINEVVSRAFYKGKLKPSSKANAREGLGRVPLFGDNALCWVDTSDDEEECFETDPRWTNPGEAQLVCEVVKRLKGSLGKHDLAIVTPYNHQMQAIQKQLSGQVSVPYDLHNVHTVQGREADVVVASLVRTGSGRPGLYSNLGFMAQRELVNVILSRARLLLVLVGNLRFFEWCGRNPDFRNADGKSEVDFWADVCDSVREHGLIMESRKLRGA